MRDFNIHTYRNDFNIAPLPFWRQNDPPDRQGISEIRYVEGLYAMWDEMRPSIRDMYLDNCARAGGGSTWRCSCGALCRRTATSCGPGRLEAAQCQNYGLNLFPAAARDHQLGHGRLRLPQHGHGRLLRRMGHPGPLVPVRRGRRAIAEIVANRKYWYGDFYPLTPCATTGDAWIAWQLHRADLDEGLVLGLRRKDSPRRWRSSCAGWSPKSRTL